MKIKVTVSYYMQYETDDLEDARKFIAIYEQELNRNMEEQKLVDFKWETVDEDTSEH